LAKQKETDRQGPDQSRDALGIAAGKDARMNTYRMRNLHWAAWVFGVIGPTAMALGLLLGLWVAD
jgi:hypothetical protein